MRAVFCQIGHYLSGIAVEAALCHSNASPHSPLPRAGSSCIDDTASYNGCNSAVLHIDQSRRDVGATAAAAAGDENRGFELPKRANVFLAKEHIFDRFDVDGDT